MNLYEYDESIKRDGAKVIAGMDEAGRGPLAGPVVAAVVVLDEGFRINNIRDSKKVPEKEREQLFCEILLSDATIGISIVDEEEIDRLNILEATRLAMHNAIIDLTKDTANMPDIILIDALNIPSIKIRQASIIKGDTKSASIASASIVAKVVRDKIMIKYHSKYPQYDFDKHKGYATKAHLDKIRKYGPSPIHRKSFRKVRDLALPFSERL
ncbi:ribonuclease HII [Thermodesulfovibrionales bacterium]|nr:ribonuclease HII [Thermodesulfovibrionales bacterium]MCL0030381.1 ribonuclease HII [Thermodesulfovibrionales bacterium]MCL0035705.1 ribonuclease HII [Thermodesulfovibrionales bacterium]MCL0040304.1 ribonuclease HII [Thermodesulfovibrionales bacterium]MCL0040954.1 ribonuclease HII [Thermodesulfovibrionales bacterium]